MLKWTSLASAYCDYIARKTPTLLILTAAFCSLLLTVSKMPLEYPNDPIRPSDWTFSEQIYAAVVKREPSKIRHEGIYCE